MSSLYILEIRPLSEVSLANMFSHTVGSLCNLVLLSLAMQKLFILMRSHLFILSFMSLALGDVSVRMLLRGMSEIFLPMFSQGLLWCYNLYLSLLSILNLFCIWHKLVIEVHFLHVPVQIYQHRLLKRLFLLHFMILPPLSNIN